MTLIKWMILSMSVAVGLPMYAQTQGALVQVPVIGGRSVKATFKIRGRRVSAEITSGDALQLKIFNRGAAKSVDLSGSFQHISDARIFDERVVVVIGLISNAETSRIMTIDVSTGKIVDSMLCYSPAISSTGRYVAFVKFFPAHGLTNVEDHYGLYDVAVSPTLNRPTTKPLNDATVGKIIYPIGIGNIADDNVEIIGRPLHEMAGERFFWNDSGEWCVFADRAGSTLTIVMLHAIAGKVIVATHAFAEADICGLAKPCIERLLDVEYINEGRATLTFRDFSGRSTSSLSVIIALRQGP